MVDSEVPGKAGRRVDGARTQSLDRAITLLNAVAAASGPDATATALAKRCGLNRATAWRLLTTLESHGMVDRDTHTGRYSIGLTVVELASSAGYQGLVATARPVLERVCAETGETADLAIVRQTGLTYVDEVAPSAIVAAQWLGRVVPLHATSTGKALLAWLPPEEVEHLLGGHLERFTDTTITDRRRLELELATTRQNGYGVCRGELESSLLGVSAPVLDGRGRPLAVVSIWGPRERVAESRLSELGVVAVRAATDIGRARRRLEAAS